VTATAATPTRRPAGTADLIVDRMRTMPQPPPPPHPYVDDPVGYCRNVLGFDPWSKQRQILESVRDNRRTAVRSAHGVGKTAIAARAALWFLDVHPGDTRVITTGASWEGVRDLLWKEIKQAHPLSGLGGRLSDTRLELGDKRFAVGLSTDKPERFQGHHADHLLLIVDEASGVDEEIFEAATGYLTNPGARMLLIGNPTQLAGEFHAAFHRNRQSYHTIHVSAFDTPAFTGEATSAAAAASIDLRAYVDEMRLLYGELSPVYDVRVLGEFPSNASDAVCSLTAVEAARARLLPPHGAGPVIVGVDVARFGDDETVIALRDGNSVRIVRNYVGKDTMRTVGEVLRVAREFCATKTYPKNLVRIVVDDPGVGSASPTG
jgi:phage terminase large subunit